MTGEVPRQVPPGPRVFVNRESELTRVDHLLDGARNQTSTIVLAGLPGTGKTSLAHKAVEGRQWSGGELFVRYGDGDIVSVADALAASLRALGVHNDAIPASLAERTGLYRTRTAGRPTLVVLDDVTDPAQVTPLVPSAPGSVVLVTSTGQLGELRLDGAEVIDVQPLDESDAVRLLRELSDERVDAEPDAAVRLVRECGGLPVAVRLMAARLIARRSLTIGELVTEVADERRGLAPFTGRGHDVTAPFTVAYRQLSEPAARMYRLLGVVPCVDVSAEIAAQITDTDGAKVLDELVVAGLVQDDMGGRYRMHSLVRRHAKESALSDEPDVERADAVFRVVDHLCQTAALADRAVLGKGRYRCTSHDRLPTGEGDPFDGDDGRDVALRWLEAERGNLAAAIRACPEQGWPNAAWQLAEAATALYVTNRYLVDWIDTSEIGARAASVAERPDAEARLRSFMSRPLTELGELPRARAELDAAFSLTRNGNDARLLASIHEMDGRWHTAAGDHDAAAAAFDRAIEVFGGEGDARGVAFTTYFLGCARQRAGSLDTARDTFERALDPIRAQNEPRMLGRALISLAEVHVSLGDETRARSLLEEAISVLVERPFHQAQAYERLAEIAVRAGDRVLAREYLRSARDRYHGLGSARADQVERRLIELSEL
ncbi:NB-ARC domain-containing protein [Herbihabitans rhizosphaerae]|uniref:NB-ARC domain-containing protein n=1 Tax=Herbihabitans rhizosphaerae TaxID=1872711 RepID=A0A4Q7KK67_9PSEU|nr:NB-ARC domain-containing protein [Herbihabitans rhizosphaerae]RZS36607.1 NB-ARC domain-containing protein [Herbihabitans rhizosphaerae]